MLNNVLLLDKFLHELKVNKIQGATIIDSTGMARKLIENSDFDFIGSLKVLFDNPRTESRVIMMALEEEKVSTVLQIIDSLVDLTEPNTGIVFTLPIDYIKGNIKTVKK
jgi:nitrogen regulatory protein PII